MIDFKVEPDGGEPFELKAGTRDALVWERTSKGNKSFTDLLASMNMVDLYHLAHIAAKRQGLYAGSLKEFEESCELHFDEEVDDPDPTQPAASTED